MTPATAAAANTPGSVPPSLSSASGPTSTTRSLFSSAAWLTSSAAVSPLPPTTAIRSRRTVESLSTAARRAWCTRTSPLSQTTTCTSWLPSTANAAS